MKRKMYNILQKGVQFLYIELYFALFPIWLLQDHLGYKMGKGLYITFITCMVLTILRIGNFIRSEIKEEGGFAKWLLEK